VVSFDAERGSGSVVLDDGSTLPFAGSVFAASPLRFLRPGQRLTISVAVDGGDAHVTALGIHGVGTPPPHKNPTR